MKRLSNELQRTANEVIRYICAINVDSKERRALEQLLSQICLTQKILKGEE